MVVVVAVVSFFWLKHRLIIGNIFLLAVANLQT